MEDLHRESTAIKIWYIENSMTVTYECRSSSPESTRPKATSHRNRSLRHSNKFLCAARRTNLVEVKSFDSKVLELRVGNSLAYSLVYSLA